MFNKTIIFILLLSSMLFGIGEANFLSLKIHYLSEKDFVVLNASNDSDERLEVFVSVLDKDGNIATKTSTGSVLPNIDRDHLTSSVNAKQFGINDIDRGIDKTNTARFVLDYSDTTTDKLKDVITVNIAGLKKNIDVNFGFVEAKGLVVRATVRDINPILHQGKYFSSISLDAENNLSVHSKTFPGGTAGVNVPIKVFASTQIQDDEERLGKKILTMGRFTRSTALDNSVVVIKALADFDADGTADVVVGEIEGRMKDGVVSVSMPMTIGMPEDDNSSHKSFQKEVFDGLGIAFIAYLKDNLSVSNRGILKKTYLNDPDKFKIIGEHNATDTVIIRSLGASNMKIGKFDLTAKLLNEQWKKPYLNYYVLDDNDSSTEQNMTITAVDSYGNPAIPVTTAKVDLDYDKTYFDIDTSENKFDDNTVNSIYTQIITMKPRGGRDSVCSSEDGLTVNACVQESKNIFTKLKILGKDGISSAQAINAVVYMGRVTTNYSTHSSSSKLNSTLVSWDGDTITRDVKMIITQVDINSTKVRLQIFERSLGGQYSTSNRASTYDPTFGSSSASASAGVEMKDGGRISIDDMPDIIFGVYYDKQSSTAPLDSITLYFFKEEDDLDNYIVIFPSSTSDVKTESGASDTTVYLGKDIKFSLKGVASNAGDYIELEYDGDATLGLSKYPHPIAQSKVFKNKVGDFVGSHLDLSIRGYTLTTSSNNFDIFVNGHEIPYDRVVSTSSDYKISDREGSGISYDIQFSYKDVDSYKNVHQILIREFGSGNRANGDGTTKTSLLELNDIDGDKKEDETDYFVEGVDAVTYKGRVYAGKYYLLFDDDNDLIELDTYGNELETDGSDTRRLEKYDYDISGRGAIGHDSSGTYVMFNERDAGSVVTVEVESNRAKNTIKFTNIIASSSNDYYIILPEKTTPQINLVNAEVTIKAVGNNNGASDDFALEISHSDANANIYILAIEKKTEDFSDTKQTSIAGTLATDGNYYILRTDRPGDVTIKATGLEVDKNGKNVTITKQNTLRFVNFDRTNPLVNVAVVGGNSVKVIVEDGSLDFTRTIIEARDSEGKTFKKATRSGNEYTISNLPKGIHQIYVYAIDVFDNDYINTFSRTITSGADVTTEANTSSPTTGDLIKKNDIEKLATKIQEHKDYPQYGKFISYNISDVYYRNWIFQNASGTQSYKLFATTSGIDPFGFQAINLDLTKINSSKWWYMIKLDGSIGSLDEADKYGWVVISQDLKIVKKLESIKSDGSLSYTALPLKATLVGEKIVFITK